MTKLARELEDLVTRNPFLHQGMREGLFNASALARAVQPLLSARMGKEVTASAVSMALSRFGASFESSSSATLALDTPFSTKEIGIRSNLELISFTQTAVVRQGLERIYRKLQKRDLFATLTEGMREATLIFEESDLDFDFPSLGKPLIHKRGVGCIAIYFPKEYGSTPGFLYTVFQQLYFQGINVVEIASTFRELLIYVNDSDLQLGFDTIYKRFVAKD